MDSGRPYCTQLPFTEVAVFCRLSQKSPAGQAVLNSYWALAQPGIPAQSSSLHPVLRFSHYGDVADIRSGRRLRSQIALGGVQVRCGERQASIFAVPAGPEQRVPNSRFRGGARRRAQPRLSWSGGDSWSALSLSPVEGVPCLSRRLWPGLRQAACGTGARRAFHLSGYAATINRSVAGAR